MKLKWTKAEWQKDQQVGKKDWALQDPDGPAQVAKLVDKVHKLAFTKEQYAKRTKALGELVELLDNYSALTAGDNEASKIVATRRSQVLKALKRSTEEGKFIFSKLKLEWALANSTLRDAFLAFCVSEFSTESLEFINAVDKNRNSGFIIATFIGDKAPKQINISDTDTAEALQGKFGPAREVCMALLKRDTFRRFLTSKQLTEAVTKMSVIP